MTDLYIPCALSLTNIDQIVAGQQCTAGELAVQDQLTAGETLQRQAGIQDRHEASAIMGGM